MLIIVMTDCHLAGTSRLLYTRAGIKVRPSALSCLIAVTPVDP